ncbi:cyclin-dependent kinase inhibitor 1C [Triticum aestivum]|uniref:cyclin-dependent kinase inhibitor 1C n=1 Tax=Triticum aestivum TaxID=4565 RepID=UPI001D03443E|nr:cyclin-dependent kinase inhibitor 1C-like [Triticum aestivum]
MGLESRPAAPGAAAAAPLRPQKQTKVEASAGGGDNEPAPVVVMLPPSRRPPPRPARPRTRRGATTVPTCRRGAPSGAASCTPPRRGCWSRARARARGPAPGCRPSRTPAPRRSTAATPAPRSRAGARQAADQTNYSDLSAPVNNAETIYNSNDQSPEFHKSYQRLLRKHLHESMPACTEGGSTANVHQLRLLLL